MNFIAKINTGLISIAFVATVAVVATPASAQSVGDLEAQIRALTAQISALQTGTSTTSVVSTGSNAACPYTWTRNLTIGSTGDDVRQLQRFLNSNPSTQVASSGVGSPGNETSYFGPATARAVSSFQELYAAQVLTPLGLSRGTGGFFTSTRNYANGLCQSGSSAGYAPTLQSTANTNVVVSGDELVITSGRQVPDSFAVKGAQRVPYTTVVLTAGNRDVDVNGVRVRRFGLSSDDNFASVALVDSNGVQYGSARNLNSDHEALIGGNITIPRGRSVTFNVVGNVTNVSNDLDSGAIAGLEVIGVESDSRVRGAFPVRGASHAFSEGVDLQTFDVDVSTGNGNVDFDEDTEVAKIEIELNSSGDTEDAYLRSITLEQDGSADVREVGDVVLLVDDERVSYQLSVADDRYTFNFNGDGVLIEEGESVDLTVETNTNTGTTETINFILDDTSDVYLVGRSYGYGLPAGTVDTNAGGTYTIQSGTISRGGNFDFVDEIEYGDNVVIGAYLFEFDGEDINMEDLTFKLTLKDFPWTSASDNAWEDAEEDEVELKNVELHVDGRRVATEDDGTVEIDEATSSSDIEKNLSFDDSFTVRVNGEEDEILFQIVADLNEDWSHFDGASIEIELTDVDEAEGVDSEKDYTGTGEIFNSLSTNSISFESVDIVGNKIDFEINNRAVSGDNYVAGSENIAFGTFEVDASDAIDDVELDRLDVTFEAGSNSTLADVNNCRIEDEDDEEVADTRGNLSGTSTDQARFVFENNVVVEAGEREYFTILCDLDNDADASDSYRIETQSNTTDKVEYSYGRDDKEFDLTAANSVSDLITVAANGEVELESENPDRNNSRVAVEVGTQGVNGVETLKFSVSADQEDIQLKDIYLSEVGLGSTSGANGTLTLSADEIDTFINGLTIKRGNSRVGSADHNDYSASARSAISGLSSVNGNTGTTSVTVAAHSFIFEDVNEVVEAGDEVDFIIEIDYDGSDDRLSQIRDGQWLTAETLTVIWEGETSDTTAATTKDVEDDVTQNLVFKSVPTVSSNEEENRLSDKTMELYRWTVTAGDDDIYVGQFGFSISHSSGVTVTAPEVKIGTLVVGSNTGTVSGNVKIAIDDRDTEGERIRAGETVTFSLYGTVAGSADGKSVNVDLIPDNTTTPTKLGQTLTAAKTAFNFVWSPDALDVASGWIKRFICSQGLVRRIAVFEDSDTGQWTTDR